jgi:phage gp29-like protein
LTPAVLSSRLDSFRVGYLRELAITYDAIEDRDINLKAVSSKRKKAASRLQWDIEKVDGADETEAERHRIGLRYFYENLTATSVMEQNQRGGVKLLVRQMMDAIGKRYACHEIVWKPIAKALEVPTALENAADNPAIAASAEKPRSLGSLLTAEFRFCPLWFFRESNRAASFHPDSIRRRRRGYA